MNKSLIGILIFLFPLVSFGSASAQQKASALSLVPDKSIAVLHVNWTEIKNEPDLKNIVKGDGFINIAQQLGVDESRIREWVVFSDINPASSSGMGIIVSGAFTSQSVTESVTKRNWNLQVLGGRKVYVNPVDGTYLLPIRNDLIAAGTKSGIEKLQTVLANPRKGLIGKPPFNALFAEFGNTAPINFVIGVPQEYQQVADIAFKVTTKLMSFTGFGLLGMIFDKIGLIQSLGFSVSKGAAVFPVHFIATMPDEIKARFGAGALNMMKGFPSMLGTNQTQEGLALQSLNASSRGKLLSIRFDMPKNAMPQR